MLYNLLTLVPGSIDTAASHIEAHTLVWLIVGAALGPVIGIALVVFVALRWVLPVFKGEKLEDRQQRAEEAEKTRQHYSATTQQRNELHDSQNQRIVDQVAGRVDRLHEKVDRIQNHTAAIVAKLGVPVALLAILLLTGVLIFSVKRTLLLAAKCEPPCPVGQKCKIAIPRDCVEDTKGKEADAKKDSKQAIGPQSAKSLDRLAGYAITGCNPRVDEGCS